MLYVQSTNHIPQLKLINTLTDGEEQEAKFCKSDCKQQSRSNLQIMGCLNHTKCPVVSWEITQRNPDLDCSFQKMSILYYSHI